MRCVFFRKGIRLAKKKNSGCLVKHIVNEFNKHNLKPRDHNTFENYTYLLKLSFKLQCPSQIFKSCN